MDLPTALVCYVAVQITFALYSRSWLAEYYAINGSFQTFGPLHRHAAGQAPFRDFVSYLGLGPISLLYALGAHRGFAYSIFLANLSCAGAALFSWAVLQNTSRKQRLFHALLMSLIVARIFAFLPFTTPWLDPFLPRFVDLLVPGTSLLPLRYLAPFLACACLQLAANRLGAASIVRGHRTSLLAGIVGGIAAAWSNDYGLPSLAGLLATSLFSSLATRQTFAWGQVAGDLARTFGLAVLTSLLAVTAATHGALVAWVRYNFVGVLGDQHWYFEGSRILLWSDCRLSVPLALGVVTFVVYMFRTFQRGPLCVTDEAFVFLGLTCLVAGTCTSIGGHLDLRYFLAFLLVAFFIAVHLLDDLLLSRWSPRQAQWKRKHTLWPAVQGVAALALVASLIQPYRHLALTPAPQADYAPGLHGYLWPSMRPMLAWSRRLTNELRHLSAQHRIFSSYSSGLDLSAGAMQPSRSDYLIHALGEQERSSYLEAFSAAKAPYATTLRMDFSYWEKWVRGTNWWWYRALLNDYVPVGRDGTHIIWQRRAGGLVRPRHRVRCSVRQVNEASVELDLQLAGPLAKESATKGDSDALASRLVEVAVTYVPGRTYRLFPLHGPGRSIVRATVGLPSGKSLVRHRLADHSYAFNVRPAAGTTRIPAEVQAGHTTTVHLAQTPMEGSSLHVTSCEATDLCEATALDEFCPKYVYFEPMPSLAQSAREGKDATLWLLPGEERCLLSMPTDLVDLRGNKQRLHHVDGPFWSLPTPAIDALVDAPAIYEVQPAQTKS